MDLSEVWALVIPLLFIFPVSGLKSWQKPVVTYLFIAFVLNVLSGLITNSNRLPFHLPWKNNLVFYNVHSILRFICFGYFFLVIKQQYFTRLRKLIPIIYFAFLIPDLAFSENIFDGSQIRSRLFTVEAFLLLGYCLLYYISKLKSDSQELNYGDEIYIVTGLSIFIVINFFIFLFYDSLMNTDPNLADKSWTVHNIAYILFCMLIARGFYLTRNEAGKTQRKE